MALSERSPQRLISIDIVNRHYIYAHELVALHNQIWKEYGQSLN